MWFWRIYLGLAAVGVVLSLLGWAGVGLFRLSSRLSAPDPATPTEPRHPRDAEPRPTLLARSVSRLDYLIGRTMRRAPCARRAGTLLRTSDADTSLERELPTPVAAAAEPVGTVKAVGPVKSGLLRCSKFAVSLGTAFVVAATWVIGCFLSMEALYWGGERLFGPDWVEFLDGLLG